jgi:hypothetical protein
MPRDVTIWGISDTELLAVVDDLADENGWTDTTDVRLQLGEKPDEMREARHKSGVGPRLAWMVRYGWLERHADISALWRLSAMGHAILDGGSLSRTFETQLNKLSAAQRVQLTREVAEAGHNAPSEVRAALRRQWQRSLIGRRT